MDENNVTLTFSYANVSLLFLLILFVFLSTYLQSIESDFRLGANFATSGSTLLLPNASVFASRTSPFSLAIQLNQMKQLKSRVDELYSIGNQTTLEARLKMDGPSCSDEARVKAELKEDGLSRSMERRFDKAVLHD
ncbi:unnamed protein product [Fraxinus pennsylvanica]|uniref:Uncharacterized protein n=1 Tax=Fraxinus pennsylvanica TaxID=56036 RepID=A0AAD2DS16_9LAMI|nr:unnamed protein product [Fraxinus pennsylvanica]